MQVSSLSMSAVIKEGGQDYTTKHGLKSDLTNASEKTTEKTPSLYFVMPGDALYCSDAATGGFL